MPDKVIGNAIAQLKAAAREGKLVAVMGTAQRKFDLERLFVPLKVTPTPPELPLNDPEREQKLVAWRKANEKPVAFGHVFRKHKRIALLALPGGGKRARLVKEYAWIIFIPPPPSYVLGK
jgi:hypothetical protein